MKVWQIYRDIDLTHPTALANIVSSLALQFGFSKADIEKDFQEAQMSDYFQGDRHAINNSLACMTYRFVSFKTGLSVFQLVMFILAENGRLTLIVTVHTVHYHCGVFGTLNRFRRPELQRCREVVCTYLTNRCVHAALYNCFHFSEVEKLPPLPGYENNLYNT